MKPAQSAAQRGKLLIFQAGVDAGLQWRMALKLVHANEQDGIAVPSTCEMYDLTFIKLPGKYSIDGCVALHMGRQNDFADTFTPNRCCQRFVLALESRR